MNEIEKQIRDWTRSVDRPIGVDEAMSSGSTSRLRPTWLSIPAIATAVVLVLMAGIAVVLAGDGDGESRVDTVTADEPSTTTVSTTSPPTTTTSTTAPAPTTSRVLPPPTPSVPPSPGIVGGLDPIAPAPCPDLRSESTWESTGDASEIVAAAGDTAQYVEVVTNEGSASCSLEGNRCGSTAQLLHLDGTPVGIPFQFACAAFSDQFELAPGESSPSTLSAHLYAPPGRYLVRVGRFDGTQARLAVRIEERHPACAAAAMRFSGNGTPVSVDSAYGIATLLEPGSAGCTVRMDEVRLVLDPDGAAHTYANGSDHWILSDGGVMTLQTLLGSIEQPPGTYPAEVSMLLADGDRISFRSDVVIR